MAQNNLEQTKDLVSYVRENGYKHCSYFYELENITNERQDAHMQASFLVSGFISFIIGCVKAKNVFEVGTYTGCSTLAIANSLPKDGKVITCDIEDEQIKKAFPIWKKAGVYSKIDFRKNDAILEMKKVERDSIDLVFIDADKERYDAYYEESLRMLKTGGLIFLDNTLFLGEVLKKNPSDKRAVFLHNLNEKIAKDERVDNVLLPISDGLTIVRKL